MKNNSHGYLKISFLFKNKLKYINPLIFHFIDTAKIQNYLKFGMADLYHLLIEAMFCYY